jgi:nucleoside 2-deoxyribosyltransferase
MKFDQYIQYRALNMKAHVEGQAFNSEAVDRVLEKETAAGAPHVKTVCAPISIELFERLTETLGLLDISKRTFIEAAIIAALDQADAIIAQVDIFEGQPAAQSEVSK